jgi:AraC family transcriptional regulator of adaptative response/methylated-DNA-[protein]-cysteine methyltransferase
MALIKTDTAHYRLVADAIHYLRANYHEQPSLADVASAQGVSESHLQRVFSAWAGVSPKRFLQYLTHEHALSALRAQKSVLDASLESGVSGPGRLHDLTVSCSAMTPGEIASGGQGLTLEYGWGASPFGPVFVAWSERGIVQLSFHDVIDEQEIDRLASEWPGARCAENHPAAVTLTGSIFARPLQPGRLHLLLRGTNFQLRVWEALLRVAPGELVSYQQLATRADAAGASRAVGSAMARNRIAWLIPCHRVIRQSGDFGSYRWGIERKLAMHGWESTR